MKTLVNLFFMSATLLASQGAICESGKVAEIYPELEWDVGDPEAHGLSGEGLEQMSVVAGQLNTSCMMVIHDGVLVGEWYWNGFDRHKPVTNVFSVTKSITSSLVGIAQAQDYLRIQDNASRYIPEWDNTASRNVTIRHLVSNDSGRFWSFESDYVTGLLPAFDQTRYALGVSQQFEPGVVWEYNNTAIQTLEAVLRNATEQDLGEYADKHLFEPIGAAASMGRDPAGNPLTYQGVTASCDDMARFGYLALRDGRWKNKQVVPERWMQKATKPSTDLNSAYGYMWWLNREGNVVEPSYPTRMEYAGRLVPGAPEDIYAAIGAFGQLVIVVPKDEYVIVRLRNVTDLNEAFATDVDPVGLTQLRSLIEAFEEARI